MGGPLGRGAVPVGSGVLLPLQPGGPWEGKWQQERGPQVTHWSPLLSLTGLRLAQHCLASGGRGA